MLQMLLEELQKHQESHIAYVKNAIKNGHSKYRTDQCMKAELAKFNRNRAMVKSEVNFSCAAIITNIIELEQADEGDE